MYDDTKLAEGLVMIIIAALLYLDSFAKETYRELPAIKAPQRTRC